MYTWIQRLNLLMILIRNAGSFWVEWPMPLLLFNLDLYHLSGEMNYKNNMAKIFWYPISNQNQKPRRFDFSFSNPWCRDVWHQRLDISDEFRRCLEALGDVGIRLILVGVGPIQTLSKLIVVNVLCEFCILCHVPLCSLQQWKLPRAQARIASAKYASFSIRWLGLDCSTACGLESCFH